jgi:flavin-binding protein dodecin
MKRRTVTAEAIKAAGARATKASAKLENREVPPGHVRSAAVEQYIATQGHRDAETTHD